MKAKILSVILILMLVLSFSAVLAPKVRASPAAVGVYPDEIWLGDASGTDVVGTEFSIAVVVEDITGAYGGDVGISWDTEYFDYVSHNYTMPWNGTTLADTGPGPYLGFLYSKGFVVDDTLDTTAGTYYAAYACSGDHSFSGNGTMCSLTLKVKKQPESYEIGLGNFINITMDIFYSKIVDRSATDITPPIQDGTVHLYSKFEEPPPAPEARIYVNPAEIIDSTIVPCSNVTIDVDVDQVVDLYSFEFQLDYNTTILDTVDVTVNSTFTLVEVTISEPQGQIIVNGSLEPPSPPISGGLILASITFHTTGVGETVLDLHNVIFDPAHDITETDGYFNNMLFKPLGAQIDLYTQYPHPFGGQGPHNRSDMFRPQKEVILYAEVTYNEWPEQNKDVSFQIINPHGTTWAVLNNRTGEDGIATVSFRTPWSHDNPEYWFGEWTVIAKVEVAEESVNDTLTFKYDYLVNTWKVSTDKDSYKHSETIEVTVDYGSYAIQGYDITYAVTGVDESGCCFGYDNMAVTIGGAEYCAYKNGTIKLYIYVPNFTRVGVAKIHVDASDWRGNPVTPSYTVSIRIEAGLRDVAVLNVWTNVTGVYEGEPVDIATLVVNKGNVAETFDVNVYANVTQIDSLKVEALNPGETRTLTLTWETTEVEVGNYTVWAEIPPLPDEYDTTNNVFIDGIVEIKPKLPTIIHDIAITDVQISNDSVYVGELLQINVSVTNKGTETETFDVSTYYDFSLIETSQVDALAPDTQTTLIFVWNTSSVEEGFYQISASAFLSNDIDVSDNTFVDGVVQVKAKSPPLIIHDVAVLNVTPSSTLAYIGDVVNIYVVVKNEGGCVESFYVTAFYDSNVVGRLFVNGLQPSSEIPLVFRWNTRNVAEGNYTLSAEASAVLGEFNIENNRFVDGVVWVKPWVFPAVWEIPRWLLALLFLLAVFIGACLVAAIVFALLWRRERKKKGQMDRQPTYPGVGFKRSKTCSECGKEFPGAYTFCPYCFTFHGKDYE